MTRARDELIRRRGGCAWEHADFYSAKNGPGPSSVQGAPSSAHRGHAATQRSREALAECGVFEIGYPVPSF